MAQVTYGSGNAPGLPPVDLPSLDDGSSTRPLRITISKPSPQAEATGPWLADDAKPSVPEAQPQSDSVGPWAADTPNAPPAQKNFMAGSSVAMGARQALTFGVAPNIAGLAAAGAEPVKEAAEHETDTVLANPYGADALGGVGAAEPFIGAYRLIANALSSHPDDTVRAAYEKGRSESLNDQRLAQEQHPWAYLAGQLGASLAVPMTGLGAASTMGRIGKSALSGGVMGGLYGAGDRAAEGAGPLDVFTSGVGGALAGGLLGGTAGSTIEGVTHLGSRVASIARASRDVEGEAGSRAVSNLHADAPELAKNLRDSAAIKAGDEAGTPTYLVDLGGENTRALMRSAANISPTARNLINEKVGSRYKQQADRFTTWIRSKFGGGDKSADLDAIQQLARKQNAPAYRKAYAEGDKAIWTPELERLTAAPYVQHALTDAISKWKNYAVRDGFGAMIPPLRIENGGLIKTGGSGMQAYPNIQLWDYAARELQDKAREAPIGSEQGKLYNDLARLLKDELDKLVPAYKAAREGAAKFFKAKDALEAGANFVTDSTIQTAKAARELAKFTPAERELFARGFASELAHQLERSGYRSDVLNNLFIASPRASQRIKVALGNDAANEFEALMRIEGLINRTRVALGNSTTTRQLHESGKAAVVLGAFETLHNFNPIYLVAGALIVGSKHAAQRIDDRAAVRIAEMLFSDDPKILARGYKIVSANPRIREALRRGSDLSLRQIVNNVRPSGVASAALSAAQHLLPKHEAPHEMPSDQYGDQNQNGTAPH